MEHYGNWNNFWAKRDRPLSLREQNAFKNNFAVFFTDIMMHWWGRPFSREHPFSLEVGAGRGTISDSLQRIGFETFTMDMIYRCENNHVFYYGDVLSSDWPLPTQFDLIVSYGLLEHFKWKEQQKIIDQCDEFLVPDGLQIHYVVPNKLVNVFEDRNVYRDKCRRLRDVYPCQWVYPIVGTRWCTNKILGKGFIIYKEKPDENLGSNNGKVTKH